MKTNQPNRIARLINKYNALRYSKLLNFLIALMLTTAAATYIVVKLMPPEPSIATCEQNGVKVVFRVNRPINQSFCENGEITIEGYKHIENWPKDSTVQHYYYDKDGVLSKASCYKETETTLKCLFYNNDGLTISITTLP